MTAREIIPPILSYEDINLRAEEFLEENEHGGGTLPVDIEGIAEFDLGLHICPFPHMGETFDLDGVISGDLTTIYVDEFIYHERAFRYRFALARAVGHLMFHADLISAFRPQNISQWKDFILAVPDDIYGWLEHQASVFGMAALMPRSRLKILYTRELGHQQPKLRHVGSKGLPIESYRDYAVNAIASELLEIFDVSLDLLSKRILKEIERAHLFLKWPEVKKEGGPGL